MGANLTLLTFDQIQQQLATAYSAVATIAANTGTGSSLGSIFNAESLILTQLQGMIAYVNNVSRLLSSASTVPGVISPDVDSFISPFGVTRNAAVAATGTVTFSTPSPASQQLIIPVGVIVQTALGVQFSVVADTSQPGYSASAGGYIIAVNATSVNATVEALIPGSSGNVLAQTITQIVSQPGTPQAPAGVSSVTNAVAFTNGANQEDDLPYIARFQAFIANRWAVIGAIASAVAGAQQGLTYQVGDMLDPSGAITPNYVSVIVNVLGQSSGLPSTVRDTVQSAVETNRAGGMPYVVVGPSLTSVTGSVTVTLLPGSDAFTVSQAVQNAYAAFIDGIGLGNQIVSSSNVSAATMTLSYAKLEAALLAVSGVQNVSNLVINGGTSDLTSAYGIQLVAGVLTVTTQ